VTSAAVDPRVGHTDDLLDRRQSGECGGPERRGGRRPRARHRPRHHGAPEGHHLPPARAVDPPGRAPRGVEEGSPRAESPLARLPEDRLGPRPGGDCCSETGSGPSRGPCNSRVRPDVSKERTGVRRTDGRGARVRRRRSLGCGTGLPRAFKQRLDSIAVGDLLRAVVADPAAREDLPALARMLGHRVQSVEEAPDGRLVINVERVK
jgi:TusA-related sulfurtransferase